MNDNVGEMPLEIFGDYVAECLGIDFPWEYMFVITTIGYRSSSYGQAHIFRTKHGIGHYYHNRIPPYQAYGQGIMHNPPSGGFGLALGLDNMRGSGYCSNSGDAS